MPDNTYRKGLDGESRAAVYLQNRGMVLLQKRYRSPFGEIDLVMRDGDTLVFVEVKARTNAGAGMQTEYCVDTNVKVAFELGYHGQPPRNAGQDALLWQRKLRRTV